MSDGKEYPTSGARDVDVSGVAVYTFGFGEDHDEKAHTHIYFLINDWLMFMVLVAY